MNRLWVTLIVLSLACIGHKLLASGIDYSQAEWVPGNLMVNFKPAVGTLQNAREDGKTVAIGVPSVDELLHRYQVTTLRRIVDDATLSKLKIVPDFYRLVVLECPAATDILKMMEDFQANPYVDVAEPNLLYREFDRIPNDAYWLSQWDRRLMGCPRVWEFSTGNHEMLVVAIDGGTYWAHEDLHDNLWVNPGEDLDGDGVAYDYPDYPGDPDDVNGIDDDGNGKIDDLIGWDFLRNQSGCAPGEDCDSQEDNDPVSVGDHGTHVIGIMGAVGNNTMGVAGVNWSVRILPCRAGYVRASDGRGFIVQDASVGAMTWALAHGASVFNMSYGGGTYSPTVNSAIQNIWNSGAVLCGAAGNDTSTTPQYPAHYNHVVAVGATDSEDRVADFSNYGTWVHCFAPGVGVMSCGIPNYVQYDGTSMASPNAAGVAALLWSVFPDYTNQQIVDWMLNNCQDITAQNPSFNPADLGHGRVDARRALASLWPYLTVESVATFGDNDQDNRLEQGETGSLTITLHNDSAWHIGTNVHVVIGTSDPNLTLTDNEYTIASIPPGTSVENVDHPVQVTVSGSYTNAYWSTLTATITADNNANYQRLFQIRIGRPPTVLVADDGATDFGRFYRAALVGSDGVGYNYDPWSTTVDGEPVYADLHEYQYIVWECGSETSNTLTADNQALLAQFLDNGGRLMLVGKGIDGDIHASSFYSNYLHCQTANAAGSRNLMGVAGDPISQGDSLLLVGGGCAGNGTTGNAKIEPVNGSVAFYNYRQGGTGAVHYDNGIYKVAYYAFALEAACGMNGTTHHSVVIHRTMDWLGATMVNTEPVTPPMPEGFALRPNYPNPFNPSTTLVFEVPRSSRVNLAVFDDLGRLVTTLVNGTVQAGSHTVLFDGMNLPSGVYFAHLQAGDYAATQRLILMK